MGYTGSRSGKLSAERFYCLGYADDLTILVQGNFTSTYPEKRQKTKSSQVIQIRQWWFRSKQKKTHKDKPITVNRQEISYFKEVIKYLVVIIEQKLTWKPHV